MSKKTRQFDNFCRQKNVEIILFAVVWVVARFHFPRCSIAMAPKKKGCATAAKSAAQPPSAKKGNSAKGGAKGHPPAELPNAKKTRVKKEMPSEAGSSQDSPHSKQTLDQLYSALKYAKSKGNDAPMNAYLQSTSREEKREFCTKWLGDKKFEWLKVTDSHVTNIGVHHKGKEGWLNKWQVADLEKMPIDSEIFKNRLTEFASRVPISAVLKDAGELEYYYVSSTMTERCRGQERSLEVAASLDVRASASDILDGFMDSMDESGGTQKALEDGPAPVPAKTEGPNKKDLIVSMKKLAKGMGDCTMDVLGAINSLKDAVKKKPYLEALLKELKKQYEEFAKVREEVLKTQASLISMDAEELAQAEGQLEIFQTHYDAFRSGALKEAQGITK